MVFDYPEICQGLLAGFAQRTKNILERRFGLKNGRRETLDAIGKNYGITRERVRQIEKDSFLKLKSKIERKQPIFQYFQDVFREHGCLKKEESLLRHLGPDPIHNYIVFLLTAKDGFERHKETLDFYSLWTINAQVLNFAKKIINYFTERFEQKRSPLSEQELFLACQKEISQDKNISLKALLSWLEVSKKIKLGPDNVFGLKTWPEINPRGIKDKAYLVLKNENQPLHFTKIASLINRAEAKKKVQERTVHNELIKDRRFVLVGRGIYGLQDWGYEPGDVKDIILKVLKQANRPLSSEEVLQNVLKQRIVKRSTVLLNLNNKYFAKDEEGRYKLV